MISHHSPQSQLEAFLSRLLVYFSIPDLFPKAVNLEKSKKEKRYDETQVGRVWTIYALS